MRHHPLSELARRCLEHGLNSLTESEERALHRIFRNETRKGAYRPWGVGAEDILRDFCQYVAANFSMPYTVLHVIDFQPLLRRRARAASRAKVPVTSLVLFATWVEHWLNMMVTVAMLRSGYGESEIERFFAPQPGLTKKLQFLENDLHLGKLPKRDQLINLVTTRNRFVHYTWRGRPAGEVQSELGNIRSTVRRADSLLVELIAFERATFDAEFSALAASMFPRAGGRGWSSRTVR